MGNAAMRLAARLKRNRVGRAESAGRTSLSKDAISQISAIRTAQLIFRETARAVSPNGFLRPGEFREIAGMSHSVTEAIEAIARGEIVIVTDDGDRENEGDLICAASLCTPEKMAFIIRHSSGIVCAPG